MPMPFSRTAINQLGKRLATPEITTDSDLSMLEELTQYHSEVLAQAMPRLSELADEFDAIIVHLTFRAKTTQTIIEKLRRQPNMALATMQDLAGIRIVGPMSHETQDTLAQVVCMLFPGDPREPKIVDRRISPSWGYRAVHVITSLSGVTIEIQIRTLRQDLWANIAERLADRLGRGIRYGEAPSNGSPEFIQRVTDGLQKLSDSFYAIERDPDHDVFTTLGGVSHQPTADAIDVFMTSFDDDPA